MLNNLLGFIAGSDGNYYFENFGEALVYALIGFLIVFAGIVIIILIIWLLGLVLSKTNILAFMRGGGANLNARRVETSEPAVRAGTDAPEDLPDDVKAAIVGAILAYYCEEKPQCEFKVKRIKRI